MGDNKEIIYFYTKNNEDTRMADNKLEFIRSKEIISRYLSKDKMNILDVGGATGAFSFWLVNLGHKISLIDFVPKHIDIAKQKQLQSSIKLESLLVGDARKLPYEDGKFDIVLVMGPLYHLKNVDDREKCLKEAYRVLKHNGRIICSYISRFASVLDGFKYDLIYDSEFVRIMQDDVYTGIHKNINKNEKYFTDAYLHHADEIPIELKNAGFIFESLIAVTSFGNMISDVDKKLEDDEYRKTLLSAIRMVESDKTLIGVSSHYMGIAKKR